MSRGHFELEAEEEYLETMYEFWEGDNEIVLSTSKLAESLGLRQATVTGMVQRLATKGLVDYEPYKGVTLTAKGMRIGKTMKRRHRLLECLLIDVMGFRGDAHEAACRMEHAIDEELEVTLDLLLGHPQYDPSGRPIPEPEEGMVIEFERAGKEVKVLTALTTGDVGHVCAVLTSGQSASALDSIGIKIGARVAREERGFNIEGVDFHIDSELSSRILVRLD